MNRMPFTGGPVFARDSRLDQVFQLVSMSRSLTRASPSQVQSAMARAWRSMVRLRDDEALAMAIRLEPLLGDLMPAAAAAVRGEIAMLRALALSLQDDHAAALPIALSVLKRGAQFPAACMAPTLCRLGYWQLGDLDNFHALRRSRVDQPAGRLSAMCAIFDLAIDAALELDQLRFSAARGLALDALELSRRAPGRNRAVAAFPASLVAQVLYEQGHLEEAENMLSQRLPGIRVAGTIDSALRAYPILARIAAARSQMDRALSILKEAETLGERRAWPRLVAASLAQQIDLLTDIGALHRADVCLERLQLLTQVHRVAGGLARDELSRYRTFARARIALARAPSRADVADLRQLHYAAASRHDLYGAVQTVVRLAVALLLIGEKSEALAVFLRALKLGAAVGLYQTFIDAGAGIGELLGMVNELPPTSGNGSRELRPYVDSLLIRWRAQHKIVRLPRPASRSHDILSGRECNILELMSQGFSNKEIALRLGIAPETVKSHAKHVFVKLAVKTRAEAVIRATRLSLI